MASFQHFSWRVLGRRLVADAHPWLRLWREAVELPDGRQVDDYHLLEMPDFVVVVASTRQNELVVERLYRHGVRRVVLALPAGHLEPEEEPMAAARRELLEETGYGAGTWHPLGSYALTDSRSPCRAHLFAARDVEPLADPASDDLEQTEILLMTPDRFLKALSQGEVGDISAVAAFLLAQTSVALHQ